MLSIIKKDEQICDYDEASFTNSFYSLLDGDREIGTASMEAYADGTNYVARLDVIEGERGKGYGTAMLQMLREIYGSLVITPDNADAARLYDRLGTSLVGTRQYDESFFALDNGFGVYAI